MADTRRESGVVFPRRLFCWFKNPVSSLQRSSPIALPTPSAIFADTAVFHHSEALEVIEVTITSLYERRELYSNLRALARIEKDYQQKLQEHISLDQKDKNQSRSILRSDLRTEEACEKFNEEITLVKGSGRDWERAAGGSASNDSKLGSSGLALHDASIITKIDIILLFQLGGSGYVTPTMTNELYQSLPPDIKSAMLFWLQQVQIQEEPTIPIIKAKMEKTLSWLAPLAANTIKAHYGFAKLGDWAKMRSRVNHRPTGNGDFIRINILYHADKEKTDPYIVELLFWLHQLVCKRRAMNNGVTCSLDSMFSSLSNGEIRFSSHG